MLVSLGAGFFFWWAGAMLVTDASAPKTMSAVGQNADVMSSELILILPKKADTRRISYFLAGSTLRIPPHGSLLFVFCSGMFLIVALYS